MQTIAETTELGVTERRFDLKVGDQAMHVNPGPHVGIPQFERDAAVAFYRRHLS
jgi:hypothetical protein